MAIIKCPECGKDVSDKAPKCIHCGYPLNNSIDSINQEQPSGELSSIRIVSKKNVLFIMGTILIIALGIAYYFTNCTPKAYYNKAEKAFAEENYEKAKRYYEKAGNYEDSADKLKDAIIRESYLNGISLLEKGEWDSAKAEFNKCLNYKDASKQIKKCDYNYGISLLESGQYADAKKIFDGLKNYEKSIEKSNECSYNIGLDYQNKGKFLNAAKSFGDSNGFKDSKDRINKIGEDYVNNKDYVTAITIFKCLDKKDFEANNYAKYAEGQIKLAEKNYSEAISSFRDAGNVLDAHDLYISTTYDYGNFLLNNKKYAGAKSYFDTVINYENSKDLSFVCDMMSAKDLMESGNLNAAKAKLDKISPSISYNGISAGELSKILNDNSQWLSICGKWVSTGGQMRTTQVGSYSDYWWYRDFEEGDVTIELRCKLDQKGNKKVVVIGYIPIYTSYSSLGSLVKQDTVNLKKEDSVGSMGTIKIDDLTSITLSGSKITANYKKTDKSQDVYFTYVYKTNVVYGKRTESY